MVTLDASESGIEIAKINFPNVIFHLDSVYTDLASKYGKFDVVVSLEVIEHLYDPWSSFATHMNY
jgi:2-polyprenyl-6-hydroxyphenyl methylase/3-demethylubiquinone-9 3-methyltransferase